MLKYAGFGFIPGDFVVLFHLHFVRETGGYPNDDLIKNNTLNRIVDHKEELITQSYMTVNSVSRPHNLVQWIISYISTTSIAIFFIFFLNFYFTSQLHRDLPVYL